jgi:N-acetylmuramoyl-L-alanine amidase CwlA
VIREALLTPNWFSRPETKLDCVRAIALHWVENPGTSAEFNRLYFEGRKDGMSGYGSAHYIIDDTETVRCIPEDEMAYHVGGVQEYTAMAKQRWAPYPNARLLGIELCHPDWTGKFSDPVLAQAVELCADICKRYRLKPLEDIVRHFDVTGKECPRWWVANPHQFMGFKVEVARAVLAYG